MAAVCLGVIALGLPGTSAAAAISAADATLAFVVPDDGLTRESVSAISRPEPPPAAAQPAVSQPAETAGPANPPPHPLASTRQHRRWRHWRHRRVVQDQPPAPPEAPVHRGLASKFFAWWHGWVGRHFHGKAHVAKADAPEPTPQTGYRP